MEETKKLLKILNSIFPTKENFNHSLTLHDDDIQINIATEKQFYVKLSDEDIRYYFKENLQGENRMLELVKIMREYQKLI